MIYDELLEQLYSGESPYIGAIKSMTDDGYPHTNILDDVVCSIISEFNPIFWLEIGSMIGNSAIKVANLAASMGAKTQIVCIDPFTGDVNMWAWENELRRSNQWRFLNLINGKPSIYERFLANVIASGHSSRILPIQCTSIVGINLIKRLFLDGRISEMPSVVYLDSAHEEGETLLELDKCWNTLPEGGILFGDDWDWPAVQGDVVRFFENKTLNVKNIEKMTQRLQPIGFAGQIVLYKNQWVAFK